jgi:hypothetical protein
MYTVTFYSYKGGVGRSLLVANCALYLAQLGLRIVAIDLDLEAPGLHYKFAAAMPQGFVPRRGAVDLIFDYATRNHLYESLRDVSFEVPLGEPMLEPNEPPPRGWLRVIPAGSSPSLEYWQRMANIDWKRFLYDEGATGLEFFVDLRDRVSADFEPDLLLIDSRTGITEIGNVATMLADKLVCVVADSTENLDGSRAVLRALRRRRRLSDGAFLEMRIAVSRPHPSIPMSTRLDAIRSFLEQPAEMLDATLSVGTPYPLAYSPEVEQKERLVLGDDYGRMSQLNLDYMAIAEDLVPESMWSKASIVWSPRIQSPYPYSVWNYSRLVLENPGVPVDGLYRVGRRGFIVIPGFSPDMRATDLRPLFEWFESEKTSTVPMELVDRVPDGAIRVPDPSITDLIELRDLPRNFRENDTELALRLPRTFPVFNSHIGDASSIIMEVERPLRPDEQAVLRRELSSLQCSPMPRPVIRVNAAIATEEPRFQRMPQGDVDLIPSRRLPSAFSKQVRDLVARDEDVWMSSRLAIHQGKIDDASAVLPAWRRVPGSRFLAGSQVSAVPGARRLLPFCDQLIITFPLKERADEDLAGMGFTREDLVALASEGRLIVLLPQSTDRYEPKLLNDLAQRAPESLVWSRALCAATMIELRRRLYPWFFPGFGLRERHERLRRASMRRPEVPSASFLLQPAKFSSFLAHVWARGEWHTHLKGAMGALYPGGGFGTLLAEQVEYELKRDLRLEAVEAGTSIETAAALSATIVPMHRPEFSLLGLTEMGSVLFSKLSDAPARGTLPIAFDLPDRSYPAMELARLDSPELRRMRALVAAMLQGLDGAISGAPDASEACRRMLVEVGALTKPDGKLTLKAHSGPISFPDAANVDAVKSMRVLRELVAGGIATTPVSDPTEKLPDHPSIVVGELAPSSRTTDEIAGLDARVAY